MESSELVLADQFDKETRKERVCLCVVRARNISYAIVL